MRVIMVSQYFAPERTAAALRLDPLARGLAAAGHDVDVVCQVPSHPEGVVHPDYRNGWVLRRSRDGFGVTHLRTWARPSKGSIDRLASYVTFAGFATLAGSLISRPDVVFASSPPLSVAMPGAALAARFRRPLVLDVRDLWPEVAITLGELSSPRIARLLHAIEARLYAAAAAITVPTEAFRETILGTAPGTDVQLLPNGTTPLWIEAGRKPDSRREHNLPEEGFLWTYAGNVGLSQDLATAIKAAELLGDGFQLLIVGEGASRPALERLASEMPNADVVFRDPVAPAEAARLMAASDALLVPLANNPTLAKTVPVKLYDSCAVGRPVVVAAPGEARRLAQQYGAAICVSPERPDALADALRKIKDSPEIRTRLVEGGRRLALDSLRGDRVVDLEALLRRVVAGSR